MKRRRSAAYRIVYAPEVEDHLATLTKREQKTVLDNVPRQLAHQPTVLTRNRKPLEANLLAPWELRIGNLRVYFEVEEQPAHVVKVVAVGRKDRERVVIGRVEVKLR